MADAVAHRCTPQEVTALERFLADVTVPIFLKTATAPQPHGTGTLLEIGDQLFLITAGHLFEGCDVEDFLSPLSRNPGEISTWGRHALSCSKTSDALDVAVVELQHPRIVDAFRKNYRRLTLGQVGLPTMGATHVLAGYPSALTAVTGYVIQQTPLAYYSERLASAPTDAQHPDPRFDLFFALERRATLFRGGLHDVPRLAGTSGAVIWEVTSNQGGLWTPERALKAVGVQRSEKRGEWFRATNWFGVVGCLAQLSKPAAELLNDVLIRDGAR